MKQKTVIKVQMNCEKCRTKAMKLVASASGVNSVEVQGEDKDHLAVAGDGVDPVALTRVLRRKVGHADVIKVEQVKEKEAEKPKAQEPKVESATPWYSSNWETLNVPAVNYPPPSSVIVYEYIQPNPDPCSIM